MKHLYHLGILVAVFSAVSCGDKYKPNYQFFPNMYEPVGYETYNESNFFANGMEARIPVEGTIPRGWMPYEYSNNIKGYEKAKTELKNPLEINEKNLEKGAQLFNVYCAICHGKKGDGQGNLVKREKFLGVPNYKDRDITQGSIYHVIYYGLNSMGSHAAQLNEKERWQVSMHVEELRNELIK